MVPFDNKGKINFGAYLNIYVFQIFLIKEQVVWPGTELELGLM